MRVYLVAAADVQDDATVKTAGFVELGPMKGNIGDQNYEIPLKPLISPASRCTA